MTDRTPILVILAGGSNSRFWPLRGKSTFPFCDTPLLELQLATLARLGLRRVAVVANPENREDVEAIAQSLGGTLEARVFVQPEPKGMGDALLMLRPLVDHSSSPVAAYVCQVHDLFEPSLHQRMLDAHRESPDTTWLASYRVRDYFPGGYLVVDDTLTITGIVEKPTPGAEPSDLVNIVAHVHPDLARLLDAIGHEYATGPDTDDHYERAMAKLMRSSPFKAIPYTGRWHPIKYPWHVLDAMGYFLDQMEPSIAADAKIAESAHISGPVHIASGVRILDGATIVGPAYIGPNTLIGQYAHVRQSMVGEHCVVGLSSEVNRSYIGRNAMMHTAKALDSVLAGSPGDEHVNLSAGMITANLRGDSGHIKSTIKGERLDTSRTKLGSIIGPSVFVGIGAMLMPGVKIGERSVIGPTTLVRDDVPDHTLFYAEQRYVSKPLASPGEMR